MKNVQRTPSTHMMHWSTARLSKQYDQPLMIRIQEGVTPILFFLEKRKCEAAITTNRISYIGKLASKATVEKLSNWG